MVKRTLARLPQVLYYCHYPDLLLARRGSRIHALYRGPLDWAEQASTGAADIILVNSEYTRGVLIPHTQCIRRVYLICCVSLQ